TAASWLPQPEGWGDYARDAQRGVPDSTLELYRTLLALRQEHALGEGGLEWVPAEGEAVLSFRNGPVTVVANTGTAQVPLPAGRVLVSSGPLAEGQLRGDTTVWLASEGWAGRTAPCAEPR